MKPENTPLTLPLITETTRTVAGRIALGVPSPFGHREALLTPRLGTHVLNGKSIETVCLCYRCEATEEEFSTTQLDECWLVDVVSGYLAQGGKLSELDPVLRHHWCTQGRSYSDKPVYQLTPIKSPHPALDRVYQVAGTIDYRQLRGLLQWCQGLVIYYPATHELVVVHHELQTRRFGPRPDQLVFSGLGKLAAVHHMYGTLRERKQGLMRLFPGCAIFLAGEKSNRQLSSFIWTKAALAVAP